MPTRPTAPRRSVPPGSPPLDRRSAPWLAALLCAAACGGASTGSGAPGGTPGAFVPRTAAAVRDLGLVPFDVNRRDLVGPGDWDPQYGKLPEIVVSPGAAGFDVALQSYDDPARARTFILRFTHAGAGPVLTAAFEAPTLGLLLGFTAAPDGGFYYATATEDASVDPRYPPPGQHRADVVRVYRADRSGAVVFDVDLDLARARFDGDAEPLINPGVASSARLALAGGQLALVHGINTTYDDGVKARHQKAISTSLDATTGAVSRTSGIWVSHSFDQRYLVEGTDLYEVHLGDAYPRQVIASRVRGGAAGSGFPLFHVKGTLGANNTFTRLGDLARTDATTGNGGFLLLLATERAVTDAALVNGSRDLALVRTSPDFASGAPGGAIDAGFGVPFAVTSSGAARTNRLQWLTDYAGAGNTQHAERPKLVALGDGQFLVLWERWTGAARGAQSFDGTYAMRIDGAGTVLAAATRVTASHLPRGDDAFLSRGEACFVTGEAAAGTLTLRCVSPALTTTETVLR